MELRYDDETKKLVIQTADRIEYHQLKLWLTRKPKNYKYTPSFQSGTWNGEISEFDDGNINFGLWRECMKACQTINRPFKIINKQDFPINRNVTLEHVQEFCTEFFKDTKLFNKKTNQLEKFYPHDYQIETAFKILKNRYCLAEVATSGGKTLIMSIVMFYVLKYIDPNALFLIIVPSISLVTQTTDAILQYNYGDEQSNSNPFDITYEEVMSDKPRKNIKGDVKPNLYVGCYQSLEKWEKKDLQKFFCITIDEGHKIPSNTITQILKKTIKSSYMRYGLSGTFPKDNSSEILSIQSVVGPKITAVSASYLISQEKIAPLKVKIIIMNHNDEQFNTALNKINSMEAGRQKYEIEKKYIQASQKRKDFILKFVNKCTKNTMLLFNSIDYGKALLEHFKENNDNDHDFYYIDGDVSNAQRDEIKKIIETDDGRVKILLATFGTVGTGYSINAIFNVAFLESFKSEVRIIQGIGRGLRKHDDKKFCLIFDFVDIYYKEKNKNIFYKHYIERKTMYTEHKYPFEILNVNLV